MTSDRAAALVLVWARLYTRGVAPDARTRRLEELASDVVEQRRWGGEVGASPIAVATSTVARTVAGMPADLLWRQAQIATSRDEAPNPRGRPMGQRIKHGWWVALAALVGAFEVVLGVGLPFEDRTVGSVIGGIVIASLGATMLAGIRVRRTRRVAGDLMIAAGTLPLYPFLWTVVFPIAGLAVAIPAMLDAADATTTGTPPVATEDKSGSGVGQPDAGGRDGILRWLLGAVVVSIVVAIALDDGPNAVAVVAPTVGFLAAHLLLRTRMTGNTLGRVGMTAFVASILSGLLMMAVMIGSGGAVDLGQGVLPGLVGDLTGVVGLGGLVAFGISTRRSRDRARPA